MIRSAVRAFLLLAIALATSAAAQDRAASSGIEELMRLSGLWTQLGQIEPQMQAAAADAQSRAGPKGRLDAEAQATMRRAMAASYAPDRLRRDFGRGLGAALSDADRRDAMEWLRTELGQRLTGLEEKSGEAYGYAKRQEEARRLLPSLPAPRGARVRRMMDAVGMVDFAATLMIDTAIGVAYGIVMSQPAGDLEGLPALRERFEAQRPQIMESMRPQMTADFAYTYREVSDADLDRYIAFAESPSGRRYHAATMKVLDEVLSRAAADMGRALARANPGVKRRS